MASSALPIAFGSSDIRCFLSAEGEKLSLAHSVEPKAQTMGQPKKTMSPGGATLSDPIVVACSYGCLPDWVAPPGLYTFFHFSHSLSLRLYTMG
jgi:hypothetical protein